MTTAVLGHTYYLARLDRVLGSHATDEALAGALRAAWHARPESRGPTPAEAALHEGISAWIDPASATVQVRAVLYDTAADRYTVVPLDAPSVAEALQRAMY